MENLSNQLSKHTISDPEESHLTSISKIHTENKFRSKTKEIISINSSELTSDEKANQLYKLLLSQAESTKKLEIESSSIRKRLSNNQREKEVYINEINQHRSVKEHFQKFQQEITEKNDLIQKEANEIKENENKKLEEINEKMNNTVKEIQEKFEESNTIKNQLQEENKTLLAQMEDLKNQALSRDDEFQKTIMEKSLEIEMLKVQVQYKTGFEGPQLKTQVDLYKNKFGEFQDIITRSEEAYGIAGSEAKKLDDKIADEQKMNKLLKDKKGKLDVEYMRLYAKRDELMAQVNSVKGMLGEVKNECTKLLQAKKGKK
jgi:DNA repair exonuclease SbcCD ATPase subunit